MKKLLACGAAAIAIVGLAPAIAHTAQTQVAPAAPKAAKVHSRAEVSAKIAEHFARLDSNRDGFVTRAEGRAPRPAVRPHRQRQ
jgi:hypothetical protein